MSEMRELCSVNSITSANYWNSIKLLLNKTHTVNKRLAGSVFICCFQLEFVFDYSILNELTEKCNFIKSEGLIEDLRKLFETFNIKIATISELGLPDLTSECTLKTSGAILLYKLLPKNLKQHPVYYELIVLDYNQLITTFIPFGKSNEQIPPYQLTLFENSLSLRASGIEAKLLNWLENVFFKKFVKWCHSTNSNIGNGEGMAVESLSNVDLEEYNELYNELKGKYGEKMVKIWPERTDPQKFVYEDIAIASYLLLVWKTEQKRLNLKDKQTFVDIGCGNGLLVYILSSEGHSGYGIDLRSRGIWDSYPDTTILKIEAITPSDQYLFPDTDWIIGNHSDELSPWIPVIAARSSHKTRFFLLPCCAFEFDGAKYQRKNCKQSQYNNFLDYIREIVLVCGFKPIVDRLKIPSTKRVCIMGMERNWSADEMMRKCQEIQMFINRRTGQQSTQHTSMNNEVVNSGLGWSENFKPREPIEKVQNCTKIDKQIEREIIKIIFDHLISKKRFLTETDRPNWNIGGIAALSDVAKLIPSDKLIALKAECGGLKTLLKNNHQTFLVQQGTVQVRLPIRYSERIKQTENGREFIYKQKPCWFLANHPDGCPFNTDDCSFKH